MDSKTTLISDIERAIDQVRPFLQADGGDIKIVDITPDFNLTLRFVGACRTCSMSDMTMKAGVEEAIRKALPEIQEITVLKIEEEL